MSSLPIHPWGHFSETRGCVEVSVCMLCITCREVCKKRPERAQVVNMLRRTTTKLHRQCLSSHRPLSKRLLRDPTNRCPFSSVVVDGDAFAEGGKNPTTHTLSDAADTARASPSASDKIFTTPITRGRTRSLRPILIPPSFPSDLLLPVTPVYDLPSSSSINQNTETDPPASSSSTTTTTTVTLTNLPPYTDKIDIRPVFERFGEVTGMYVQLDGRRADVVFADVSGVKRALHAYAEKPLRVRGREITVFRKHTGTNKVSGMDVDASTRATRTERDLEGGAIFVSNFPPTTTQEELLEALEPFGNYEEFKMRMSFTLLSRSQACGLSERT
jgi:RNA recognition motif. (a.k.a. RRM, RBD, or RNP domain)